MIVQKGNEGKGLTRSSMMSDIRVPICSELEVGFQLGSVACLQDRPDSAPIRSGRSDRSSRASPHHPSSGRGPFRLNWRRLFGNEAEDVDCRDTSEPRLTVIDYNPLISRVRSTQIPPVCALPRVPRVVQGVSTGAGVLILQTGGHTAVSTSDPA